MPTREQKIEAARIRRAARDAVVNTIRCGGSAEAIAEEAIRQIELRYELVPKPTAGGKCPVHPFVTLVRGVCGLCGPKYGAEGL